MTYRFRTVQFDYLEPGDEINLLDHAGHRRVPESEFVVQQAELEYA